LDGHIAPVHFAGAAEVDAVAFASATRAVAIRNDATFAQSDDSGATFTDLPHNPGASDYDRVVAGARRGTAYAIGSGIARSTDDGRSWQAFIVRGADTPISAAFPTARTGFALDSNGRLFATAEGGARWRRVRARGLVEPGPKFPVKLAPGTPNPDAIKPV